MPYKSRSQAGKFHEMLKRGEISKKMVDEFDAASKGMKLPYKVKQKSTGKSTKKDKSSYGNIVGR